jgi:ribosomal protein S18 acetylase RimI-like enzyme
MIQFLTHEDVIIHRAELEELFSYCKEVSTGIAPSSEFCKEKIDSLISYLKDGRALLIVYILEKKLVGFLWACKLNVNNTERLHLLYFAVLPQYQKNGIGKLLITAAEEKARDMDISLVELNVTVQNESARQFYLNNGYISERITLVKHI